METPTTISSEVPPKKNGTPSPWVIHSGMMRFSVGPTPGIIATFIPLMSRVGRRATSAR